MAIEIRDSNLLKLKLSRADNERQPVSFLFGAPFSLDLGVGVPGIEGFLEVIRDRVALSGKALLDELDNQLGPTSDADRYQTAMAFVYDALDAQAAADIVETAVLRARKAGAPSLDPVEDQDGVADDWHITRAQRGLALAMKLAPDRFPGPVFTTNFDPMISLALIDRGFDVKAVGIPLEGSISASVKLRKSEVDVFHLHGYWHDSATLHRPQQLLASRPQLQQSLQRHLDGTHLVVMACSGWDDIFTTALSNCLSDPGFRGTISWCFYQDNPAIIELENKTLFDRFGAGIAKGNISFFCGIDCHDFFDGLIDSLGFPAAVRSAVETSPIPGWQMVTQELLDAEPPLSGAEAVRFFDGAVPTLRHAASPLIPRLSHADTLISRLSAVVAGGCGMQLLRAAGGEGKSTALLQAAVQAARSGGWNVVYRPATDTGLKPDTIAQLDPGKNWLIVADDAEGLITELWSAADMLHRLGRTNVFFLVAARDTDWRAMDGDSKGWSTRLNRLDDLTFGKMADADAGLVVDAWATQGGDGLRALQDVKTRDARVSSLLQAARTQGTKHGEGSFFGGLLETRFGAAGLVDHLLPLLEPLRHRRVAGDTATFYDALLYIANCHSIGMPGLDKPVLANLVGVPTWRLATEVLNPLGSELGIAESREYVLTRHKRVADAIVEVAAKRHGVDLGDVWRAMVKAMVSYGRGARVGPTFTMVIHSGGRLKRDLPQTLDANVRGEIGIAAAEAAMEAQPERLDAITNLARALRLADSPEEGSRLLRDKFPHLRNAVDKVRNIRGYYQEWGTCAGILGGRESLIAGAWLGGCSVSDTLPVDVTPENAALALSSLGVPFRLLSGGNPRGVYEKALRATVELGRRSARNAITLGHFEKHGRQADALGAPKPADDDEALVWLADAAFAASQELDDPFLRSLKRDGRLTFERLRRTLISA